MSLLVGFGEHFNLLSGANAWAVSSENTLFPKENAVDYDQSVLFAFNAAAADDTFDADLTRLSNGNFSTWTLATVPDDWTDASTGTGALSEELTIVKAGSGLKFTAGGAGNFAIATYEFDVVSGWAMTIESSIYGDASVPTAIQVRNLHTGSYLTSAGAWQAAAVDFDTQTAASWSDSSQAFTVEAYSVTLRHKCTIRITVGVIGSGVGYADSFACWPHWDFASVHGHNLGQMIDPTFQSDDNGSFSSATARAACTVAQPSFFKEPAAMVTERYLRLLLEGTNYPAAAIGQIVAAQITTLTQERFAVPQDWNYLRRGQHEVRSAGGQIYRRNRSGHASRGFPLTFKAMSETNMLELLNMIKRSDNGAVPGVLVPDDTEPDVMFGHFGNAAPVRQGPSLPYLYDLKLDFEEEGFAIEVK